MKRLLLVSLLVNMALLAVLARAPHQRELAARAEASEGSGAAAAGNGDVNGNGAIDISDPVYILNWLFSGGPEPVPCGGGGLPDTGQDQCFDCEGRRVDCNSCVGRPRPCSGITDSSLLLQDAMQGTGCPDDASRFTIHADDTVTDNCTGLQWQRFTADTSGDGSADRLSWCEAMRYCSELSLAGHQDWRMPNVRELQSIVDYGRFNPAIGESFISEPQLHWTSTSVFQAPADAFGVEFQTGEIQMVTRISGMTHFVRAVRNAR